MKSELFDVPFDHFQRYAAVAHLVEALGPGGSAVLEIGANRQRLLGEFLPGHDMLFSDLEEQDNPDGRFVRADATALPFADDSFDCSVSLDVFEHIPSELRAKAASEMARVSRRLIVICCPLDRPWVHQAEHEANRHWEDFKGSSYPWLEEHKEFGLVEPEVIEHELIGAGWKVLRFGHGESRLWSSLMGSHFLKEEVPELAPLVSAADRLYNRTVFAGDRSNRAYREFFVAVRDEVDHQAVAASVPLTGESDPASASLLESLATTLRKVVGRTRHAEKSWAETARCARELEARVSAADREREIWETKCQGAYRLETELRRQLESAYDRESGLSRQLQVASDRESGISRQLHDASERVTELLEQRKQLENEQRELRQSVNQEREAAAQKYAELLTTVRRRWRITLATTGLLIAINAAVLAALLLGNR